MFEYCFQQFYLEAVTFVSARKRVIRWIMIKVFCTLIGLFSVDCPVQQKFSPRSNRGFEILVLFITINLYRNCHECNSLQKNTNKNHANFSLFRAGENINSEWQTNFIAIDLQQNTANISLAFIMLYLVGLEILMENNRQSIQFRMYAEVKQMAN